ncbi:MAG: DUF4258 domain-containing protein [Magnetospirillum sp. WYHS-4]
MNDDLANAILTDHARTEMARRQVTEAAVREILKHPQESSRVRPGRVVVQSVLADGYLLRVFVDIDRSPPEVVTVYRTSRIAKYSRLP